MSCGESRGAAPQGVNTRGAVVVVVVVVGWGWGGLWQRGEAGGGRGGACLDKGVHGEDGEVGLALGVVDQVEVHELLQLDVPRLDAVEHVGEQHRDVLTHGHRGDDLLDRLLLLLHLGVGQLLLELADLACRAASQVSRASRCARSLTAASSGAQRAAHPSSWSGNTCCRFRRRCCRRSWAAWCSSYPPGRGAVGVCKSVRRPERRQWCSAASGAHAWSAAKGCSGKRQGLWLQWVARASGERGRRTKSMVASRDAAAPRREFHGGGQHQFGGVKIRCRTRSRRCAAACT